MADKALEAKNKGNAAFSSGDFQTAVKCFTEAIGYDSNNHVLFSNRSAAYCSMGKYEEALQDANKTVELKPDWSKGYGRKGAALYGLHKYQEALQAYDKGLQLEPANAQLKKGRDDVEAAMAQSGTDAFADLLKGDIWTKLRSHPKTAAFCNQPDFVSLVNLIKQNPRLLGQYLADPRVAAMLGVLLGIDIDTAAAPTEPMETEKTTPTPPPKEEKKAEKKEPEKELPENKKKALEEKDKGTECYKKKDFEAAIQHYSKAMELDPDDIVYKTNRAAVYFEMQRYDDCIKDCKEAIEEGRKHYADYKLIARAFARMGNSYMKQEQYAEAIDAYNHSLTEHRTPDVLASLQKVEKLKKEKEDREYINPQISQEEKEKGNDFFKKGMFPEAIKAYSEAIRRSPSDHTLYSNRAACYTKLGDYPLAVKDCDECLKLCPTFVKAYIRKGLAQYYMKEYHKCLETYDQGLKLEENNAELLEGVQKTMAAINRQSQAADGKPDEERLAKAMADPEIQAILRDPIMMNVLQDMQTDPKAATKHLRDATVSAKINKLIAAGVLRTG
jgi:stress-induced-phosphoprotein 1